jgi:hypothetical protein
MNIVSDSSKTTQVKDNKRGIIMSFGNTNRVKNSSGYKFKTETPLWLELRDIVYGFLVVQRLINHIDGEREGLSTHNVHRISTNLV